MGRTARYKKIKSCDPYSKKNAGKGSLATVGIWGLSDNGAKPKKRSRTAERMKQEKINRKLKRLKRMNPNSSAPIHVSGAGRNAGLDRPPSDNEDEFDMSDLQGSLSRQKRAVDILNEKSESSLLTLNPPKPTTSNDDDNDDDDDTPVQPPKQDVIDRKEMKEATQLLKMDATGTAGGNKATKHEGRQANESKRAFNKRVKSETRQIIKQQKTSDLNPEKRARKKEFLKAKKQKKKGGKGQAANNNANSNFQNNNRNDYDSDDDYRRRQPDDQPHFTVQAERPPTFNTLPRGASAKKGAVGHKRKMNTDKDVQEEQANLEKMRQKVQEQYAIIKAKRKRAGDFHL